MLGFGAVKFPAYLVHMQVLACEEVPMGHMRGAVQHAL